MPKLVSIDYNKLVPIGKYKFAEWRLYDKSVSSYIL